MIKVLFHPRELPENAGNARVVVLDVLRATSTIITALHAGAKEIRLFDSLDGARAAKPGAPVPAVLTGEQACLKPNDFDLGNSPREHVTEKVGGSTVLLATTNGTRAAVAGQKAGAMSLYVGCLLNATATAKALVPGIDARDTILLCAGTNGEHAVEDVLGAGAILFSLLQATYRTDLALTDSAWTAYHAFAATRQRLPAALRLGQGGINVINAGLEDDIDACARLDAVPLVARIIPEGGGLVVRRETL